LFAFAGGVGAYWSSSQKEKSMRIQIARLQTG
jgi:hypothetical protein